MDFECDLGYFRTSNTGDCQEMNTKMTDEEKLAAELERQNEQCMEYGYYEVTQGYRKIPGNICSGGIDLSPYRYKCNMGSYIGALFSFKGIFILGVIGVVCYFFWPMIEAIVLVAPIPDPTDLKNKAGGLASSAAGALKNVPGMFKSDGPDRAAYAQNFDQVPGGGQEEDDDDDEEDIGRHAAQNDLNYDSDEREEPGNDGDSTELISLDNKPQKDGKRGGNRKNVPALRKPA